MSEQRQLLTWGLAALFFSLVLIAILIWRHRNLEDLRSTFLVGDPHAGSHTFRDKGCSFCHAVNGVGGKRAPDLGFQLTPRSSSSELVIEMWNHAPRMWAQMEAEHIAYPSFGLEEMTDLFAYLYTARYADEPGNLLRGRQLFVEKTCARCHSLGGAGGKVGPDLKQMDSVDTPMFWAQAMWNHAPAMEAHMQQMHISWPQFDQLEMNDLLAYIRRERAGPRQEFKLLPAEPRRGRSLFRKKGCITCHSVGGEGGSVGPDLRGARFLSPMFTELAGRMWNHSPEMWKAMQARGMERPQFEGQEMADLIAFLHSIRYFELAGSSRVGEQLFAERKCSHCHGADARGGQYGPALRGRTKHLTQVTLAKALWAHGPHMYRRSQELGLDWPTLQESDLGHLLAFLNTAPDGTR